MFATAACTDVRTYVRREERGKRKEERGKRRRRRSGRKLAAAAGRQIAKKVRICELRNLLFLLYCEYIG